MENNIDGLFFRLRLFVTKSGAIIGCRDEVQKLRPRSQSKGLVNWRALLLSLLGGGAIGGEEQSIGGRKPF